MRIHFDNVTFGALTGPNTFAKRLAQQLFVLGHNVLLESKGADVSLVFIEPSGAMLANKVVQRLDGIWFKPNEFRTKNIGIRHLYENANAIIFQSEFDKKMIERWWGDNHERQRPYAVIGNGVKIEPVKEITIPTLAQMRSEYDRIFVCSGNWHSQKRLGANIRLFQHLRKLYPKSCLIIMGDHPDVNIADPHVFYTGAVDSEIYMQIYAVADWMLHLAWADHCPNVVVEALSQGTPIVCSDVGGTKELIGHGAYGIVLKERDVYDFELYDYDNPPEIDVTQLTFLPTRHELDITGIPSIDINVVAMEYVKLFDNLCR